ncbi:MAG: hypothetical protein FJX20_00515 [Alphaproteobacteria bacterium]|nr:hypothetical protein [Alphaproteobacteria bacterium]
MMLGRMIERLDDEAVAIEAMIALDDLALLAEIDRAARDAAETPATYAAGAARRFAAHATDDDWLALMTAAARAEDPGVACLRRMLLWSLRHDAAACGCGRA